MPKSSAVGIHLHEQHLPERVITMELEQLLQLLANLDKPHLEQLIYALIDIHGLTYTKISSADILQNLDRCPHLSSLTNTTPTVGRLSSACVPIPDSSRARILLNNYDRSYSVAMQKLLRQQQARLGSFQIKRW